MDDDVRTLIFLLPSIAIVWFGGTWFFLWNFYSDYTPNQIEKSYYQPELPELRGPIIEQTLYSHVIGNTSILIKTMNKDDKVSLLVHSIETLYPKKFKILIGDDGIENKSETYENEGIVDGDRIRYIWFGFDIGVSAGRNRLVSLCETKYVINMDDDMYWTGDTNIYELFKVHEETEADIITMSLIQDGRKMHYQGDLYMDYDKNEKVFCRHEYPPPLLLHNCSMDDGEKQKPLRRGTNKTSLTSTRTPKRRAPLDAQKQCYQTDIGYTMYFSTREFLFANPWKGMIGAEHINWFWSLKKRKNPAEVVGCLNIAVFHNYRGNTLRGYTELRKRAWKFNLTDEWRHLTEQDGECCRLAQDRGL